MPNGNRPRRPRRRMNRRRPKTYTNKAGNQISIARMRNLVNPAKQISFDDGANNMRTDAIVADDSLTYIRQKITEISRGDLLENREGGKVSIKGIGVNLVFANNGFKNRALRIMVVNKKDNTEPDSTLSDILLTETYVLGGAPFNKLSQSVNNPINRNKYNVLCDRVYRMNQESVSGGGTKVRFYCPLRDHKVTYDQTGLTNVPVTGGLTLLAWVAEYDDLTSPNTCLIRLFTTVYFRDGHYGF